MTTSAQHNQPMNTAQATRWARVGVLAALAVVIGWVETFIPLPLSIAGVKLGLANIVVLVALLLLGKREAALVALIKVLATGFLFGNPLMMFFSAAGTLLAYVAMVLLVKVKGLHLAVVSVVAAMAHNIGQLAVAQVVLGTPLVWYSAPLMLLAACATGALCGFAAKWTLDALAGDRGLVRTSVAATTSTRTGTATPARTAAAAPARTAAATPVRTATATPTASAKQTATPATTAPKRTHLPPSNSTDDQQEARPLADVSIVQKLIVLIAFFVLAFHANTPISLAAVAIVALALAAITNVRIASAVRLLVPLAFIVVVTIIMQLWYHQEGLVLAQLGPVYITDAGLWSAIRMVIVQASVILASVAFMRTTDPYELVRALDGLLRPLQRLGLNTEAVTLSLTVALTFIPVLVREFTTLRSAHAARGVSFEGSIRERLANYTRLFAPLVRSSFRHADNLAESLLARAFN